MLWVNCSWRTMGCLGAALSLTLTFGPVWGILGSNTNSPKCSLLICPMQLISSQHCS